MNLKKLIIENSFIKKWVICCLVGFHNKTCACPQVRAGHIRPRPTYAHLGGDARQVQGGSWWEPCAPHMRVPQLAWLLAGILGGSLGAHFHLLFLNSNWISKFNLHKFHQLKILSLVLWHARRIKRKTRSSERKIWVELERRGSTSSWMRASQPSTNGKKCLNRGSLRLLRHTLNGAILGRGFLHGCYKKQCKADKANLHFCQWPIFKEQCIEICQHIYEKPFLERSKCPFSILRMVYAKCLLGKGSIGWPIQSKSNMKAPLTLFFGLARKFPHGGLGKKMSSIEIPNNMVVYSTTSSDDEKSGWSASRRRWYKTPSPRWLPMRT